MSPGRWRWPVWRRWRVEESFQQGKGLDGLDEHQVRRWASWQRRSLLVMTAYVFVAVCRLRELRRRPPPPGLLPLTCDEVARLLHELFKAEHGRGHALGWSVFRGSRQAGAQKLHYRIQTVLNS